MSMDTFRRKMDTTIAEHGYMVLGIGASPVQCCFHYTIGLYRLNLPEVLIFGMPYRVGHMLINDTVDRMLENDKAPQDGEVLHEIATLPLVWRDLPADKACDAFTIQAANHAGRDVAVGQLVWPDPAGRFPWDPGCNPGMAEMQSAVINFRGEPVKH